MHGFPIASRRPVAALLIPLIVVGCYRWRAAETAPRTFVEAERPAHVRVTTGHSTIEMQEPRIVGDSLIGSGPRQRHHGVRVALADVTRVDTPQLDGLRTGLLVGSIIIGLAALAYVAVGASLGGAY